MAGQIPVSRGLQQLLNEQKREAEQIKQQGQQQQRLLQEQLRYQRETLRSQQRSHREVIRHYAKQGASTTQAVQQMKNLHGLRQTHPQHYQKLLAGGAVDQWDKFTKQEQALLERLAKQGASHTATERALGQFHRQKQHRQYQQQQQQYLGARQQQESDRLGQRELHGEERFEEREQQQEQKEQQRHQQTLLQQRELHRQRRIRQVRQGGAQAARGAMSGNASSLAGGLGTMMAGGEVGMLVGLLAGAIGQGMEKAAGTLNIMNDSRLTGAQRGQKLAEEWIPGYEKWVKLRDAINGVADKMYKLTQVKAHQEISSQHAYEKASVVTAAQVQTGHYRNLAKSMNAAAVPGDLLHIDRSTVQGETAYREAATRLPHQAALSRAEAEAQAAQKDVRDSRARTAVLDTKGRRLKEGLDRARQAEENLKKGSLTLEYEAAQKYVRQNLPKGSETAALRKSLKEDRAAGDAGMEKVHRTAAAAIALKAEQDLLNHQKLVMEEINRQKEIGVTLAEKESAVRKAQNQLLKADLELLKQKEQRSAGLAGRIGSMSKPQQARTLAMLKIAEKRGLENLPPSMRQHIQQFLPEWSQKQYEQTAPKSALWKQAVKMEGKNTYDEKGDFEGMRREIARKSLEVEVNVNVDVQALAAAIADKMADAFGKKFEKLIDAIDTKYKTIHEKNRTGQNERNANL